LIGFFSLRDPRGKNAPAFRWGVLFFGRMLAVIPG
jgi:hypothetical protein